MSFIDQIGVLILTYNEAPNIGRTLDALNAFSEIVVLDSGSTDGTLAIVAKHGRARVAHRDFDDFASQCNFGLSLIEAPWALSLDADYELSEELIDELTRLDPGGDVAGYRAGFIYRIYGAPLRGTLYPARAVLYRRDRARYLNRGHGHRVTIDGPVAELRGKIFHDDRKPLMRWLASQQRYARAEADYLLSIAPAGSLRTVDRLRRMGWAAPILVFLYTLIWKRCLFDGWRGWLYVLQRTLAETMIALEIVDRRLQRQEAARGLAATPLTDEPRER
ncbi:MAG: glycosyltransferase family 2 protein [Methylocystis sp.]